MTFSFDPTTASEGTEASSIPYPVIDPRNDGQLADEAMLDAYSLSNGALNDTSEHNPLKVFASTLSRLGAEVLWYVNKLPRALAVAFLNLAGVQRSLGQAARVSLRFSLSGAVTTPYSIPIGFEVQPDSSLVNTASELTFRTIETLVILPGQSYGDVLAECTTLGTIGNVPRKTLTRFSIPYANIADVRNLEDAYGGADAESLEQVGSRALTAIRVRDTLISQSDYELTAMSLLGEGSRAIALSSIGADGSQYQIGSVHVFGIKSDRTVPSQAECDDLQNRLSALVPLGTSVYFSAATLVQVDLKVIIQLRDGFDPAQVFTDMQDAISAFIDPATYSEKDYVSLRGH